MKGRQAEESAEAHWFGTFITTVHMIRIYGVMILFSKICVYFIISLMFWIIFWVFLIVLKD